jgi:hypothetical protein
VGLFPTNLPNLAVLANTNLKRATLFVGDSRSKNETSYETAMAKASQYRQLNLKKTMVMFSINDLKKKKTITP